MSDLIGNEALITNLIIGIIGSVIGAIVIFIGQFGLKIKKKSKEISKKEKEDEELNWELGSLEEKSSITNKYLFIILKYLFLANLLWVIPEFLESIYYFAIEMNTHITNDTKMIIAIVSAIFRIISLILFYLGIGNIARYMRL